MTRVARLAVALLVVGTGLGACAQSNRPQQTEPSPNLLFVLTDDQRFGTLSVMPAVRRHFDVDFRRAFVTTPVCCPSRATYLTGSYVHDHDVHDNDLGDYRDFAERDTDTLGPWLQAAGYYTGFVGKYFNEFASSDPAPPGWDEFYGYNGDGIDASGDRGGHGYTNFALRERWTQSGLTSEERVEYTDAYTTTVFADKAAAFIDHVQDPTFNPQGKPWALFVWTKAPHFPFTPEPAYRDAPVPRWDTPPSFLEASMRDKPREVRENPFIETEATRHRRARAKQLRSLMSVDNMVERLFGLLAARGMIDQTWGLFTSDNGIFWGEHRFSAKTYAYEEAVRVPFRMAVPGKPAGSRRAYAANIDVAPTLLRLAGADAPPGVAGVSLVDVALGEDAPLRNALLIEGFGEGDDTRWIRYDAVRTRRWKYVSWVRSGHDELYELTKDPYELRNVAAKHPRVVARMRDRIEMLKRG